MKALIVRSFRFGFPYRVIVHPTDLATLRGGGVEALSAQRTAGLAFQAGIVGTLSGLPDGVASLAVSDNAIQARSEDRNRVQG